MTAARGRATFVVALTIALALGALWFPRAEDPGRADADGYRVGTSVAGTSGPVGDWYDAGAAAITRRRKLLMIKTGPGPLQVFSRPLAVYAGHCYEVRGDASVHGAGPATFSVTDEDARRVVASAHLRGEGPVRVWFRFDSGPHRRVALAIVARSGLEILLGPVRLAPVADSCPRASAPHTSPD
jgi:hypothetical protein